MRYWIIYLVIAFFLGVVLAIFEWPFWIAVVFLMAISFIFIGEMLYTIYISQNSKRVAKFIKSKQKEPIYRYVYMQGHGSKEDQIEAIDAILHKYKQPHIQHYYRCLQFILKERYELALEEANQINKEPLMTYSNALVFAQMGKETEALAYSFSKVWMQESILASVARTKHDRISFERHAQAAIDSSRGVQRLSLIYAFNN
ncbi:hypothetical protein D1B33_06210 [Lysinibacillus yapensis]|uniref:Uncharacterized protein n=1 Tax=Ureibacillus yapensis TaxID=2304605 RepID=A0A396SQN2_9BACL|nr:hypothetical protein [Lysinibacillus yapensis]RHW38469.1 hypothetical protein D1B33_06210 [Lysinibacillus yapensis]